MSLTTLTVTGSLERNGEDAVGYTVELELSTPITDGTTEVLGVQSAVTDNSGDFSIASVTANDDQTTSPQGSTYTVRIKDGNVLIDRFSVIVPAASAPTVDLFSLPRIGSTPGSPVYGVASFNGRRGIVTLLNSDLVAAGGLVTSELGATNGVGTLDSGARQPLAQVPALVAKATAPPSSPGLVPLSTGTSDSGFSWGIAGPSAFVDGGNATSTFAANIDGGAAS